MKKANVKLLITLAALIVLVAAVGLIFGKSPMTVSRGKGPLTITATEGLIIPDPQHAPAYSNTADTSFLVIRADGFTYPQVPLLTTGDYTLTQPDGSYNILHVTQDSICVSEADCSNQDCVSQGAVSRGNADLRPMGSMIVCLPHKLIIELMEPGSNSIIFDEEDWQ
jgi:hypothetical protein